MNLPRAPGNDRRAHDRHPFRVRVVLAFADGRQVPGRALDLGAGGAGVICDLNVPVGVKLALRMKLPARPSGSAAFESLATVAHCSLAGSEGGFRLGLQFDALSPAALAALKGALPA